LADIDRDLLIAVLAVVTDVLPREALSAAVASWSHSPGRSFADFLADQGVLGEEQIKALRCLVATHLKNHNGDILASLDAWDAQQLTRDILTEIEATAPGATLDATVAHSLAATLPPAAQEGSLAEGRLEFAIPARQRFELIRPHAKGGIGQVWVARDLELQREVAVKEIQPRYAGREDQKARFLLEAEITGNLEHPGIVPVYSLGTGAEGRPYYAMRFIRGESLSAAIKEFHKRRQEEQTSHSGRGSGLAWGVEFQQLLRRFLDVCDAMEYAHSRGVIHRDLKPGNIMLGRYGETLVVDWGLAKVVGKSDIISMHGEGRPGDDFEPEIAGTSTHTGGETEPGTTIGTPSYMSPEQARGAIEELGPASDVYSLGATLYEILTGSMPFPGKKAGEIIALVKEGKLVPPRSVLPTVPAPLEAICLKAMAFEPAKRYQSARELALDLEHWMADEPVAAYPERLHQRLSRWLRRHRSWTFAGAAALMAITTAASVAVVFVEGARRREEGVRIEAQRNFALAQKAVDEYLTKVSEDTLLKEQDSVDIRRLRQKLLQTALDYYNNFARERGDDPALRKELANAYFRVAIITREIESERQALEHFAKAARLWAKLVEESPDDRDSRYGLAQCDIWEGRIWLTDDPQVARRCLQRALAILEPLAKDHPSDQEYKSSIGNCHTYLGSMLARSGQSAAALETLSRARAIHQQLADLDPSSSTHKSNLAEAINWMGYVYVEDQHDYASGLKTYEEVKRICLSLLEKLEPKPVRVQHLLALSEFNIGVSLYNSQREKDSIEPYRRAVAIWSELSRNHRSVNLYQEWLARGLRELAQALESTGDHEGALTHVKQSIDLFRRLVDEQPELAHMHGQLAYTWGTLGYFLDRARQNREAIDPYKQAVSEAQEAVSKAKEIDSYKRDLYTQLENLGEQFVDLGEVAEGLSHYEQAIQLRRELHDAHPEDLAEATELAGALSFFGGLRHRHGRFSEALQDFNEARGLLQQRQAKEPVNSALSAKLAAAFDQGARVQVDLRQPDQGRSLLEQAAVLLRAARERGAAADLGALRRVSSEVLWDLARVLRILGRPEKEIAAVEAERLALWQGRPAPELIDLARDEAIRASVVEYGKPPSSPQARAVRENELDLIRSHLRLAASFGFRDVAKPASDPAFLSLFSGDEIKALLAR
jgi:serine/threonine-protein kinase